MKITFLVFFLLHAVWAFAETKTPDWVENSKKGCNALELCAVGSGESRKKAEVNARIALSKIFDTKISSKFNSSLSSSGSDAAEALSEEINEATESALSGVEIEKQYEDKLSFYALAVINKAKTAEAFKKEITQIDDKMKAISKNGEGLQKVKLESMYVKREVLNQQYHFLMNQSIPSPLSYDDIFKAKATAAKGAVVHVYLDESEPKSVEGILQGLVTDMGFKATSGRTRNKNSTHVITGEVTSDKQYMKVEGFEKYKFILKIRAQKSGTNIESGHLNFEVTETGRNYSQAYDQALPQIQDFLKKNMDKLNIE